VDENANTPEKKLFVDEDWKTQVEREQEAARKAKEQDATGEQKVDASAAADIPMPPANLLFLIGTLYLQGAMALGLLPNPITKKSEVQRGQAKLAIDLLDMLQQKTEGNRTAEESEELETVVHQLRMAYVGVTESVKP
jgi:hypothetical protein